MAEFITIRKNNPSPVSVAPSFTEKELFKKSFGTSKVTSIRLTKAVLQGIQAVRDFVDDDVRINCTIRTVAHEKSKGRVNKSGNAKGLHPTGAAIDISFTGSNAIENIRAVNTQLRDKGELWVTLRRLGVGGFGLYGPNDNLGRASNTNCGFIHLDSRNTTDKLFARWFKLISRPDSFGKYSYWIGRKNPLYLDESVERADEGQVASPYLNTEVVSTQEEDKECVVTYEYPGPDSDLDISTGTFTVEDYLLTDQSFIGAGMDINEFLNYSYNGLTNRKRIYNNIPKRIRKKDFAQFSTTKNDYPLFVGIVFHIPCNKLEYTYGNEDIGYYTTNIAKTFSNNSKLFPEVMKLIHNDPGFKPTSAQNIEECTSDIYPRVSVKIWSRVLFLETGNGFLDITPYVISCNTDSNMEASTFSVELPHIMGRKTYKKGQNEAEAANIEKLGEDLADGEITVQSYISKTKHIFSSSSSEKVRRTSYLNHIISQNDLIWIKYEKLDTETSLNSKSPFNQWTDLYGMVDNVSEQTIMNDKIISIRGRDMMKVLIEENSFFSPYSIGHKASLYGGTFGAEGRGQDGVFIDTSVFKSITIKDRLEFIFHRIATVGWVDDIVFNEMKDKTLFDINVKTSSGQGVPDIDAPDGISIPERKSLKPKGVWQSIKLFIDEDVADMQLFDWSISRPQGSIHDLVKKLCQYPFVEFFGDTYGDKYYLIVRRPPFKKDDILRALRDSSSITSEASSSSFGDLYSEYLQNKKDESTKSPSDNTDKSSSNSIVLKEATISSDDFPNVINIDDCNVISDNLYFSNQSYSWYKIEDKGFFQSQASSFRMPSAYFEEYAQAFGNKVLEISHPYSNFKNVVNKKSEGERSLLVDQSVQLLSNLIEIHAPLPFTREGTIVLNGDRRIRKGTYIYYRPTQEVFYVNAVSNNLAISAKQDRTTTLQVSRGMIRSFIDEQIVKYKGKQIEVSYFNIINIKNVKKKIGDVVAKTSIKKVDEKDEIILNKDVFDFFLEKNQFMYSD